MTTNHPARRIDRQFAICFFGFRLPLAVVFVLSVLGSLSYVCVAVVRLTRRLFLFSTLPYLSPPPLFLVDKVIIISNKLSQYTYIDNIKCAQQVLSHNYTTAIATYGEMRSAYVIMRCAHFGNVVILKCVCAA